MDSARECRHLAERISDAGYKRVLEAMADGWAQLAADRKVQMRGQTQGPAGALAAC